MNYNKSNEMILINRFLLLFKFIEDVVIVDVDVPW